MTDNIVERLRLLVPSDSSGAAFDAVNEITRLRNELHIAQEWSARVIAGHEQDIAEITALRAENEKLRTALETMQRSRDRYRQAWEAEKVRARAALTSAQTDSRYNNAERIFGDD